MHVLGVSILPQFCDFDISFWNFSDSVELFVFHFISIKQGVKF
jgi:hypothetical protein